MASDVDGISPVSEVKAAEPQAPGQLLSAESQRKTAQRFNLFSVTAILLMPVFPILLIWIAGSILVYASSAHHPNPVICRYVRYGGYRFYGLIGSVVVILIFTNELKSLFGGAINMWLAIWLMSVLVVVPMGIRDIWSASKENWADMHVETF
jgi:hypothetical protein